VLGVRVRAWGVWDSRSSAVTRHRAGHELPSTSALEGLPCRSTWRGVAIARSADLSARPGMPVLETIRELGGHAKRREEGAS